MICKKCKQDKPDNQFALSEGYKRNECKACTKKNNAYYMHPECFYNLFVGKQSWKHIYFKKTIIVRKSF